jgi:hypothetical protein
MGFGALMVIALLWGGGPGTALAGDEGNEAVLKKLDATKVTLDFQDAPITDVLNFLSAKTGIPMRLDADIAKEGVIVSVNMTEVSAKEVLNITLQMNGLTFTVKEGTVIVHRPGKKPAGGGAKEAEEESDEEFVEVILPPDAKVELRDLAETLEGLKVGKAIRKEGIAVFPLVKEKTESQRIAFPAKVRGKYTTSGEARLILQVPKGDHYLPKGYLFRGGSGFCVLTSDILLSPREKEVPADTGVKWLLDPGSAKSFGLAGFGLMTPRARLSTTCTRTDMETLLEVMKERKREIAAILKGLSLPKPKSKCLPVGLAVAYGGTCQTVDLFGDSRLFLSMAPSLLEAAVRGFFTKTRKEEEGKGPSRNVLVKKLQRVYSARSSGASVSSSTSGVEVQVGTVRQMTVGSRQIGEFFVFDNRIIRVSLLPEQIRGK